MIDTVWMFWLKKINYDAGGRQSPVRLLTYYWSRIIIVVEGYENV